MSWTEQGKRYLMTVSVPQKLRTQMEGVKGVNWSAVAQEAFKAKLAEIEKAKLKAELQRLGRDWSGVAKMY